MGTIFRSFSPDLKHVFQKTDEIRLYFYNHSHRVEKSVLGNLLLDLVHNNGTVRSSCRKKTLPGNRTCIHIFNLVGEISSSIQVCLHTSVYRL